MAETVLTLKKRVRRYAEKYLSYDGRNWLRLRQIEAFIGFLAGHPDARVLEISPGWNKYWRDRCSNYESVDYPDFDICKDVLNRKFDVIIADQVLEHVPRPQEAAKNIYKMLTNNGHALIATPFLFRIHARPHDYQRWTEEGLRQLLVEGGFADADIQTYSWGNKACARAHIGGGVHDYGWHRNMHNDPEYPLMVWAFAQKRPASTKN